VFIVIIIVLLLRICAAILVDFTKIPFFLHQFTLEFFLIGYATTADRFIIVMIIIIIVIIKVFLV
jgi:hypothetical protein